MIPNLKLSKETNVEKVTERTIERRNIKKIFSSYYEVLIALNI